jgi:hypothetical protein
MFLIKHVKKTKKKGSCMAAKEKRKKWTKWCRNEVIKFGPGPQKIKEFVLLFLKKKTKDPMKFLAAFGTTLKHYRSIDIFITEITLKADGFIDVFGETYFPDHPTLNGQKVRILNYDPHRRFANSLEIFE